MLLALAQSRQALHSSRPVLSRRRRLEPRLDFPEHAAKSAAVDDLVAEKIARDAEEKEREDRSIKRPYRRAFRVR